MKSCLILAASVAVFGLVGCKKGSGGGASKNGPTAAAQPNHGTTSGTPTGTAAQVAVAGTVNIDTSGVITSDDSTMRLSSSVSLATPKSDTGLPASTVGTVNVTTLALAAATDFDQALSSTFVADQSMGALANASGLLCLIAQSAYTQMVGKGEYVANIDEKACDRSGGGSNGRPTYTRMVANATRATDGPIVLSYWMTRASDSAAVSGKVTIVKGATAANPFGIFRMNYKVAYNDGSAPLKGYLEAVEQTDGHVVLKMWDADGNTEEKVAATFTYDATAGKIGSGLGRATVTALTGPASGDVDYTTAYNDTVYLAKEAKASSSRCLDRANYQVNVYGYTPFDKTTGAHAALSAATRGLHRTVDGADDYGSFDADGIHFANTAAVANGDQIKVEDAADYTKTTTYTAHVVPGKLEENSYPAVPLAQIKATRYRAYSSLNTNSTESPNVTVQFNTTTNVFDIIEELKTSSLNALVYEPLSPGVAYSDITAAPYVTTEDNFYGGVTLSIGTSSANSLIGGTHAITQTIAPATDQTYWCYSSCPVGGASAVDLSIHQAGGTPSTPVLYTGITNASSMKEYQYKAATGLLVDLTNSQNVTADFKLTDGTSAVVQAAMLIADADYNTLKSDATFFNHLASNQTTYTWTTGYDFSTKTVTLLDGQNQPLTVTTPVDIVYTHTRDNDRLDRDSVRYGTDYSLRFTSWSDLQGIPQATDEGGTPFPAFGLKDGTVLGTSKVKARDVEERMPDTTIGQCSVLDASSPPNLPDATSFTDPALGTPPTVTEAAAVIAGVLAN